MYKQDISKKNVLYVVVVLLILRTDSSFHICMPHLTYPRLMSIRWQSPASAKTIHAQLQKDIFTDMLHREGLKHSSISFTDRTSL